MRSIRRGIAMSEKHCTASAQMHRNIGARQITTTQTCLSATTTVFALQNGDGILTRGEMAAALRPRQKVEGKRKMVRNNAKWVAMLLTVSYLDELGLLYIGFR